MLVVVRRQSDRRQLTVVVVVNGDRCPPLTVSRHLHKQATYIVTFTRIPPTSSVSLATRPYTVEYGHDPHIEKISSSKVSRFKGQCKQTDGQTDGHDRECTSFPASYMVGDNIVRAC